MLSQYHIKEHAKSSVYTHLPSCIAIVAIASFIPILVSAVANAVLKQGVNFYSQSFDEVKYLKDFVISQLIYLVAVIVNMPFQYCLMRYFLVLSGTAPDGVCSFKVFFTGFDNAKAFLKGSASLIILNVLSCLGIIVGYYPVFLSLCMAPFYLALNVNMGVVEALKKSRELMRGHKMEAFRILLEFILIRLVAWFFSGTGLAVFAILMEILSLALFYTSLAVIFVRLDMAKKAQAPEQNDSTPSH